jgi:dipeptidyl aminopeptidase/acylaminoacyl peptidase
MVRHWRSLSILLLATPLAANAQGRAFELSDWYRVTRLAGATLSPDGNTVAFTVTTVKEAENKRHNEVWIQPLTGGSARRMTSPNFESANPRWSPDGKTLFFTSERPGGRGTEWAVRMDEGGEAFQPEPGTAGSGGGSAAGGGRGGRGGGGGGAAGGSRPTDSSFTITAGNAAGGGRGGRAGGAADSAGRGGPYAAMQPMARPPAASITKPAVPNRFDGKHIIDASYKSNGTGFLPSTGRSGSITRGLGLGATSDSVTPPVQLFIQRRGAERVALTSTAYSHASPSVSPDGKWVIFSADSKLRNDSLVRRERDSLTALPFNRARNEAVRNETELYIMPVAACESKSAECTPRRIEYTGIESDVSWSPDSRQIAFVGRPTSLRSARLFVVPAEGGKPVDVLGTWQYEPGNITWWKDGTIRMETSTGGSTGLWQVNPATKTVTPILSGRRQVHNVLYDRDKTKMVYIVTDETHPTELYTSDVDGKNERKLTSFNDKLNAEVAWQASERFTYKSVDNLEIEAWLMKPYGYQTGKKYPVVLYIHGGPHSAYGEGWFDEFQNLAATGMFVLFTNPRGSSGTNADFTNASRGDWGGKDYIDLMKAVDIVAQRPDVDSTRMGVTGGSYGGFMTAWITTKTNRFKAAEADRMISDWTAWWGTTDVQGLTNNEFFGAPWENQVMYDTLSPIRFVKKVKTPTLIVQSEEDHRTPMATAEMWFQALRLQGVQAEFVRYPRSNHDLSRTGEPWLLVDRLGRLRQWFGHFLLDTKAAATSSPMGKPFNH